MPGSSLDGLRPGTRSNSDLPSNPISSLAGGLEQDWCRNNLSPFLQHSFAPEHREHRSQGVGRHGTASCASAASQVFIWAKGETLVGGVEGPMSPLWTPPCTLPYLSPSSQESVVFLLPIYYDCICAATTPLPMGGEGRGGVQDLACSTFSTLELYQIKSLVCLVFHC